ncbi:hypothetical protein [Cesiribacter sp. SM1]|uniref:DUF922 domain-containing protein n=1 Tax=Cesiribacter sp. SM1 TaxID=2861196 RepID=UPI001CD3C115|nr:hypothetical protein [Cesiribacter sp. SM1]
MKNLKTCLFGILLLTVQFAQAQSSENGIKRWDLAIPLQWTDFSGKPDTPDTEFAAATYAGLELDVVEVSFSGLVTFKVRAVFDSHRSWAHPDRKDDYVLAHEQLHFDIAEVYARRLERKLNSMQIKVKDKEVAKRLALQYNEAQMKEQGRFDKDCVHGLDRKSQEGWRNKVDRELKIKRAPRGLVAKEQK